MIFGISTLWLKLGAAGLVLAAVIYGYFHIKGIGYDECKADWTAAEKAAIERGLDARRDAERDVDRGVSDDKYDRDRGPM